MKKLLFAVLCLGISMAASAQAYNNSIGVRGGLVNGLNYKTFIGSGTAMEFVLDPAAGGFEFSAIYEKQQNGALGTTALDWYYGAGGAIGFYNGPRYGEPLEGGDAIGFAAVGLVGLEFPLKEIPIVFSGDIGPAINLTPYGHFYFNAGLSMRYYW